MSRTIRRSSAKYHYSWVLRDYVRLGDHFARIEIDRYSKQGKKELAVFHSDSGFGCYAHKSPPHWYRRWRNKVASNKEKQYIQLWNKLGDDQYEVPKMKRVSDASWYW